jgi:hypothetical protein
MRLGAGLRPGARVGARQDAAEGLWRRQEHAPQEPAQLRAEAATGPLAARGQEGSQYWELRVHLQDDKSSEDM